MLSRRMLNTPPLLARRIREEVIPLEGVVQFQLNRRAPAIFLRDNPADCLYFINSGYIKIAHRAPDGREVLLSILGPGELFGEQAIYPKGVRSAEAQILQHGVICSIPREVFLGFCDRHQEIWHLFGEMMAARERDLQRKIELLCLHDVEDRVLYYLEDLAAVFGSLSSVSGEYSLPLSQTEFANLVGASRETVSTTLNALSRSGLVRLGRRLLVVSSLTAIRSAALVRVPKADQG